MEDTYGIDHLTIGESTHGSDYPERLLAQCRIFQMENKTKSNKCLTHKFKVLSNILNHMKRAKSKNSHYSTILKGCMNTRNGGEKFRNVLILLDSQSNSTIMLGKLT